MYSYFVFTATLVNCYICILITCYPILLCRCMTIYLSYLILYSYFAPYWFHVIIRMNTNLGYYPKWSSSANPPQIFPEKCPSGSFNPTKRESNKYFFNCKKKNTCSGNGQRGDGCPSGGITGNQLCRCDYQEGFISSLPFEDPTINPDGIFCFNPITQSGRCYPRKCKNGFELNRGVYMYKY